MSDKLISVIMCAYNEPLEWVKIATNSILKQTYSNFELIIVLDNPNNQQLYDYFKKLSNNEKIKFIRNEKNLGLAQSLNKGLSYCNGDFVARMDADDISLYDRFEKQIKYLASHKDIDMISNDVIFMDENGKKISSVNYSYDKEQVRKYLPVFNMLIHPTYFMRKEVVLKVGGYRNFDAAEDYDFALRALDFGFSIEHIDDVVLFYRRRANSMSLGNGLVSQLNTNYIKRLHKERVKNKIDTYSYKDMKKLSDVKLTDKKVYSTILVKIYSTNQKHKIKTIMYCVNGFLQSKYFRKDLFKLLYIKYLNSKHRKGQIENEISLSDYSNI